MLASISSISCEERCQKCWDLLSPAVRPMDASLEVRTGVFGDEAFTLLLTRIYGKISA